MPHATKIASFEVWKTQYNRRVIRDSKAIKILSPIPEKPKTTLVEKVDPGTGKSVLDSEGKKILEEVTLPNNPKFKEISVFDVTQTRGSPITKLVEGIPEDAALYGAFFDSLKIVSTVPVSDMPQGSESAAQTLMRVINEVVSTKISYASGIDLTLPQVGERLIQESIAYILCFRFGIDVAGGTFDYLADYAKDIQPRLGEILDLIKTEASNLISTLEDSFKQLCEKQGINPMMEHEPETLPPVSQSKPPKPPAQPLQILSQKETPLKPLYNVTPRIEKTTIGVDFTHYDVFPVMPALKELEKPIIDEAPPQKPAPQEQQVQILRKYIPPDPSVSIADRDKYGYTRRQELLPVGKERAAQLFSRRITVYMLYPDNREAMIFDLTELDTHSGIFGIPSMEWYNSREYLALA